MSNIINQHLRKVLSNHFIKFSLIPILVVEITLLILYFSINKYISSKNIDLLLVEARNNSENLLKKEANIISDKLTFISNITTFVQKEHESIFSNPDGYGLPNGKPQFSVAPNNVFYKTNKVGSSLYYSSQTKITSKERNKATFTEAMDVTLKNVVDINPLVVAAYFNSWDNLNRLYPFIDNVSEQYGEHISMEDYNFYYLADKKHNPAKKAVWTGAYLDPAGNGWMLSCIAPIYKNDFLEGVTGLDITIDSFVKNILNEQLPYDAKLFLVDKEGMILVMPEKIEKLLRLKELKEHLYTDSILKTIEKPEEYNILKNGSVFSSKFKKLMDSNSKDVTLNIDNKEYLALAENVNETNWKLMILIDKSKVFGSINNLQDLSNKIGYIAIGLLLLFYIIFFYLLIKRINEFSHKITQPIIDLSKQTSLMAKKNIEFKKLNTNIIEISQLSNNFVYMIDELKIRTKKLYDAKVLAEEANRAKDDFLANMSHELKTPLNSINIISNLMFQNKSKHFNEKELKNLEVVSKCGKDLMYLINDILDLSKLNAGKMSLDNRTIDVKKMIKEIYESFDSLMKEKNLEFILHIDENIGSIFSDETRIGQIIKNLLSNSLKFTPKGRISLIIKDMDDNIKISVQDEGIGIPSNKLKDIFDRFKQVDSSTTRKYGGTGLGLAICKELVTLLGGKISVKSEETIGSLFEVILPKNTELIDSDNTILEEKNTNNESLDFDLETTPIMNNEKVLVLNNNPVAFLNIIIELKKKYEVKQLLNLEQLLKYEKEEAYSKVIIDISKLTLKEKKLINNINTKVVIIYENEIDDLFKNDKFILIKKPLSSEVIKNI